MSHRCPGPACTREVPPELLACPPHWFQVPRPIRAAVVRAWDDGAGFGTDAHRAAAAAAVATMAPLAVRTDG